MEGRKPRENFDDGELLVEPWGNWQEFMKPDKAPRNDFWVKRNNGSGWRLRPEYLRHLVPTDKCGVYEIKAQNYTDETVVYVGSTCQDYEGLLEKRISEYATSGSHKQGFINTALERGFSLLFRFATTDDKALAEQAENALLADYDYAWNVRGNGHTRDVFNAPAATNDAT